MRHRFGLGWILGFAAFFASLLQGGPVPAPIPVFVSILPQVEFVERIGGNRVQVDVLVGPGQSHHSYEPGPRQVSALARARAFFRIGVPVEESLLSKLRRTHPGLVVVDTIQGVPLRTMEAACAEPGHDHHAHAGGKDPHTWMSPRLVKIQARAICEALARLDPAGKAHFEANLKAYSAELDRLDARLAARLAPLKGRKMYVFHPAFGYFADAYGLLQVPIETEGKEPGPRQLARLVDQAKRDQVKVMFVQPQFSTKSARAVAASLGGAVVPIDPLARDYLANLERLAAAVEQGLR